jgi:hypothetical protein
MSRSSPPRGHGSIAFPRSIAPITHENPSYQTSGFTPVAAGVAAGEPLAMLPDAPRQRRRGVGWAERSEAHAEIAPVRLARSQKRVGTARPAPLPTLRMTFYQSRHVALSSLLRPRRDLLLHGHARGSDKRSPRPERRPPSERLRRHSAAASLRNGRDLHPAGPSARDLVAAGGRCRFSETLATHQGLLLA